MMDDLPSILVVTSSNTKPKSIIKLITKENPTEQSPGVVKQPWKIDTKYYSAIVNLIGINESYKRTENFNNQVEALIIHMDTNKASGLEDLKQWKELESDCDPEVKLLLANYCNDSTKITKSDAMTWCVNRGFEFVELYPSHSQDIHNTEEDTIPEKFGVARVIEALQAHTWTNLVMKKTKNYSAPKSSDSGTVSVAKSDLPDDLLVEDDFTELFSHLHMMKDSLQTLPVNQRKQCAEQMVTAFWKAIGGDEEEILDL